MSSAPTSSTSISQHRQPTTGTRTRIEEMKSLLPAIKDALKSFVDSGVGFRVLHTVSSGRSGGRTRSGGGGGGGVRTRHDDHGQRYEIDNDLKGARSPSSPSTKMQQSRLTGLNPRVPANPKTLLVLDSSYNPPSRAHAALAIASLAKCRGADLEKSEDTNKQEKGEEMMDGPAYRLLLLFSTHNADKAVSSIEDFKHRIAMMILFARDLVGIDPGVGDGGNQGRVIDDDAREELDELDEADSKMDIDVDIGLTNSPYYTDKALAIMNSPLSTLTDSESLAPSANSTTEKQTTYPLVPTQIHLLGYDTLTRFLAPKYYAKTHDPPLSAVAEYFEKGHRIFCMLRPGSTSVNTVSPHDSKSNNADVQKSSGGDAKSGVEMVKDRKGDDIKGDFEVERKEEEEEETRIQRKYIEDLAKGSLASSGFKEKWARQIEIVDLPDQTQEKQSAKGISSTIIRKAASTRDFERVKRLCTPGVAAYVEEVGLYR